jgi:hypothetical protein
MAVGLKYRVFEPTEGQGWPTLGVHPFVKIPTRGRRSAQGAWTPGSSSPTRTCRGRCN